MVQGRAHDPAHILIVNPFGIGDVLFTTPLVRAIRRAFPASRVGYLCNRRTERILRQNPNVNELFVYEKDEVVRLWRGSWWRGLVHVGDLLRRLRAARVDFAIDLSLGERYSFVLALLGVPRRTGFNYRKRGHFLTEWLPIDGYHDEHVVDYYRRLLHFVGIRLVEGALEVRVREEDVDWARRWCAAHRLDRERLVVGMVPAGGASWGVDASFRRWSFEGFASVGDALAEERGAQIVLFGEATDRPICQTVARLMRHQAIDLSGQTTLGQFVSLLGHLGLVICNDGGPLHLAVSQGVKTVSVFGPVDPCVYGPYPPDGSRHRVVHHEQLPCRPCYRQFRLPPCPYERACLAFVDPADVLQACRELLGRPATVTPALN